MNLLMSAFLSSSKTLVICKQYTILSAGGRRSQCLHRNGRQHSACHEAWRPATHLFSRVPRKRLPFSVRVRDSNQPAGARMAFISEPRPARNGILGTPSPLPPVCTLNIALPDDLHVDSTTDLQTSLEQPTLASSSAHCLNGSCRRTFSAVCG